MKARWLRVAASLPAIGIFGLHADVASAEGAVRILDCTVVRSCDGAGNCKAQTGKVIFRMKPQGTATQWPARYSLSYGDTHADMISLSETGPFVWTLGEARNTLLPSSDTQFLWHRLTLGARPESTIQFLSCVIRQ